MNEKYLFHPGVYHHAEGLRKGEIDRREFVRIATMVGVSAPVAYALAGKIEGNSGGFASVAQAQTPVKGGHWRCSMRLQDMTDPATFSWVEKSNVARHIVEYLTITGADNITRPYLLERWKASEDLKTWDLFLRKGVRFNNGDEFTADDVIYNFKRWLDPKTGSSLQSLLSSMITTSDTGKKDKKGKPILSKTMTPGAITRVDKYTVRLNLNRPELSIPEVLHNYPSGMVHRRFDEWGGDLSKKPVGTGPYLLQEFQIGQKAVLVKRNPKEYWGEEVNLDKITYVDTGDEATTGLSALVSGQVDSLYEAFVEQLDVLAGIPNIVIHEAKTSQTGVARMQVDVAPFNDIRVRTAIRLCQDHERLLELAYRGKGSPAEDHHVAPIQPDYSPMAVPRQDIPKAKQLLKEAGYANGLSVSIDLKKEPPWELAAVQALAQMCKPAGININLNVMPTAQYWDIWDKAPFGFTAWTHRPLGILLLNLAYRSGVPWNESHYANPEYDKILDEAGAVLDYKERQKHMAKLQTILQRDAVIAQPLWRSIFTASHKRVQNMPAHPTLYHHTFKSWISKG